MNVSPTDICNASLRMIGAARIHSLDDGSLEARTCKFHWPMVRLFVFRSVPWKCISKPVSLTESTTAPAWGFRYAYPLPDDFVRMVEMEYPDEPYEEVGKTLHTNSSPANIRYVYDCRDPTYYTADLVRALYLNLAYELAFSISQAEKVANQIKLDLERFFMPLARMNNSVGSGQRIIESSTFTDMFL